MSSQSCDAGEAGTGTNGVCEACAVGQFRKAGTDANSCIGCIVGRYQSEKGQASCLPCIPGSFMDITGATKCKKCNENFKSETPGSTKCLACGTGKRSSNGSAVCQDCQPGEAGTPCSKCEPGKYRGETDETTVCKTCVIGQSSTTGSASCTLCDLGRYGSSSSPGVCAECIDKKEYQDTKGKTECLSCKLGDKWTSLKAECTKCDLGTYGSSPGVCTTCIDKKEYQDTKGESRCLNCTLGEEWTSLISKCSQCDFGKYGSTPGTCQPCLPGTYQNEPEQITCKDCAIDTYLEEEGKGSPADCIACDKKRSTGLIKGNTLESSCLCKRTEFYTDTKNKCQPCPDGADCSFQDGLLLTELTAKPGYWRSSIDTENFTDCKKGFSSSLTPEIEAIKRCPGSNRNSSNSSRTQSTTAFTASDQCRKVEGIAYGGPSCMACLNASYVFSGDICKQCPGGSSLSAVLGAVGGINGLLFIIFSIIFMKAKKHEESDDQKKKKKKGCCGGINKKKKKEKTEKPKEKMSREQQIESQKGTTALGRFGGDQAMVGRMQGSKSSGASASSNALANDAHREDTQVIVDRVKIVYGWLQIFTALTFTFDIAWPMSLRSFSLGLGFINLDIGNILGGSACTFAVPFLDKMVAHVILPGMLFLSVLLARLPAYFLRDKKHRKVQKARMVKLLSSLSLILYPGLCTRLFSSLKVVTVYGLKSATHTGRVLAVDYSVEYLGKEHMPYVWIAIGSMILYVLGIPFFVLLALKSNKKYLYSSGNTEEHKQRHEDCVDEFGTLYLQYEPKYWYWEVTVIFKKMLLTGAMTIIASGSSAQMVIALLVVLFNLLLVLKLGPFVDNSDDWLAFLTSMQMLLTLLGGLLLMTDNSSEPTYDPQFMGTTMIIVNSFGFIALAVSLCLLHPKCRKRCNKVDPNEEDIEKEKVDATEGSRTKVTPVTQPVSEVEEKNIRDWKN